MQYGRPPPPPRQEGNQYGCSKSTMLALPSSHLGTIGVGSCALPSLLLDICAMERLPSYEIALAA